MEQIKIKNSNLHVDKKVHVDLVNETLNIISKDSELTSYLSKLTADPEVVKRSWLEIRRYIESNKLCKNCQGYYNCLKKEASDKGIVSYLTYNKNIDKLEEHLCECKYLLQLKKVFKQFDYSDFELSNLYLDFVNNLKQISQASSNIENSFASTIKALIALSDKFSLDTSNLGAYIVSDNLNSSFAVKFLCMYMAIYKKLSCSIIDANIIFNDINSYDNNLKLEARANLEKAESSQVLGIVSLGLEAKSKTLFESVILPLIIKRNSKGKITYISSYYPMEEYISNFYTYKSNSVKSNIALFKKPLKEFLINDVSLF